MSNAAYNHIQHMNPTLEMKYLRLEKSRNRLLTELEGYDDALLNSAPAEGKWSAAQVVAHLILVEKHVLNAIKYKINHSEGLADAGFTNELKSVLLRVALKSGRKFKAPVSVATVPDSCSLKDMQTEWDEARFELEDVLTDLPKPLLHKCVFKHPYVGPLTIQQTLTFIQDHFDHHLRQINQLKPQHL